MMGDVADEADQLAAMEGGRDGVEIHDVLAAAVRIVGDDDVPRRQVLLTEFPDQFPHRDLETGQQAGRMVRLGHRLPFRVRDDAGNVLDFRDDRRAAGAHQRIAHLVGYLFGRVADHLHRDEIVHAVSSSFREESVPDPA